MDNTSLATVDRSASIEKVLVQGDLSQLAPAERIAYYKAVCESVGLNPFTKPFEYITLNGKLTLYAKKDATDQLRSRDHVSIVKLERERIDSVFTVTAYAATPDGRQDSSIGAVNIAGLNGDALANALMKAETKAKRRVTLSICGLGMLDETEIETIPDARPAPQITVVETKQDAPSNGHAQPPVQTQPPAQRTTPPSNGGSNGTAQGDKAKPATIKTAEYSKQVAEFVAAVPYYTKDGKQDDYHILGAAAKCGFAEITTDNIGAVWGALKQYAHEQEQAPA